MNRWILPFLAGAVVTAACPAVLRPALAQEAPALVEKGAALLKKGDWPGARDAFLAAVKKDGKNLEARRGAAEALLGTGSVDEAIEQANAGLDLCENKDAGLWLLIARAYLHRGETLPADRTDEIRNSLADAKAKAAEAIKRDGKLILARAVLAKACRMAGDSVTAGQAVDEGLAIAPMDFDLLFEKGMVAVVKTDHEAALAAFTAAAGVDPKSAETHYQRAMALSRLKRSDECYAALVYSASADEKGTKALQTMLKWSAKKTDRGASLFRAVLKEKPDHAWAHAHLAYAMASMKDEPGALGESKAAMKLAPDNMEIVAWHGYVLDVLGKKSEAIATWRAVLQKDPANVTAGLKLWDFALNPNSPAKLDERKEIIEILAKSKAEDGVFWSCVGLIHRDISKDYKRSLEAYLKAAALSPTDQGIQNDTGLIYLYHGASIGQDPKQALPYFERCLALVREEGQDPDMGYRDTLENLSLYWSTVEKNPEKCLDVAVERNDPEFLNRLPKDLKIQSPRASQARMWAEKELKR